MSRISLGELLKPEENFLFSSKRVERERLSGRNDIFILTDISIIYVMMKHGRPERITRYPISHIKTYEGKAQIIINQSLIRLEATIEILFHKKSEIFIFEDKREAARVVNAINKLLFGENAAYISTSLVDVNAIAGSVKSKVHEVREVFEDQSQLESRKPSNLVLKTKAIGEAVSNKSMKYGSDIKAKATDFWENRPAITINDVLNYAMKLPVVNVNRKEFLTDMLSEIYESEEVKMAVEYNPAYAGIDLETIDEISNSVIKRAYIKVKNGNFIKSIPGTAAKVASVVANMGQYFAYMINCIMKIAYLYGFPQFDYSTKEKLEEVGNEMLLFLGTMFDNDEAKEGVRVFADSCMDMVEGNIGTRMSKEDIKSILMKAGTSVGKTISKQLFSSYISKNIPGTGEILSIQNNNLLDLQTYLPIDSACNSLKKCLSELYICDPECYE